jgi:hypothetical protein
MKKFLLPTLLVFTFFGASAQRASKKPLDYSVFDGWQNIVNDRVSNDGKWVLYVVKAQEGDANLYITDAGNKSKLQVPRADTARMTADSKYAVFLIKPFYKDTRMAKIKKKKPSEFPKDTLGIVILGKTTIDKFPGVRSFKMADKASVIAYLTPADSSAAGAPAGETPAAAPAGRGGGGSRGGRGGTAGAAAPAASTGAELTVKQLLTGKSRVFKNVTDYQLSKDGKTLAFAVTAPRRARDVKAGVFVYNIDLDTLKNISSGRGTYRTIAFDDEGKQIAFAAEKNPERAQVKPYQLYYYNTAKDSAEVLAGAKSAGMPANWSVSGDGRVYFSKKGGSLFFGTAPIPKPVDTTIVDFEVAKLDIWNYKDDYLQPQQLKNAQRELRRSYLAVIRPAETDKKLVQLADVAVRDVSLPESNDAGFALGIADTGAVCRNNGKAAATKKHF